MSTDGCCVSLLPESSDTSPHLNWFSKTSIIKWHKAPVPFLIGTVTLWIASVGLYMYDYRVGFAALGFLSLLHVYLEFPLNYHSFIGIGREVRGFLRRG